MKILRKLFLIILLMIFLVPVSQGQANWEMGVRFGDDFALDFTVPLSKEPRLHGAVYFDENIALGAYFDWMFALEGGPAGLKFYPGVGPELYFHDDGLDIAAAGDFGVEYSFNFPLTVGLDWRPNMMITDKMKFSSSNWGVLARFRFGEGVKFVKAR